MVGVVDDPVGQRMGLLEGGAETHDGRVRHIAVELRLHQQHIAAESRAGLQGSVAGGRDQAAAVLDEVLAVEQQLGRQPVLVAVDRRYPQGQPAHRAQLAEDRRQVAAMLVPTTAIAWLSMAGWATSRS